MVHLYSTLYVLLALSLSALSNPISGTPTREPNLLCVEASCLSQISTRTDVSTTVQSPDLIKRTLPSPIIPRSLNNQDIAAQFRRAGWLIRFRPYQFFLPIRTSSAALIRLMNRCMALAAAHMLNNDPVPFNTAYFNQGPLALTIIGKEWCGGGCGGYRDILKWELVYYLLLYVRNHAARGFSGTGSLLLRHVDGTVWKQIEVNLILREGVGQTLP
ncbi:MAG: hypothetical protein Q9212_005861 [Teloschistes hypoglaucus]